MLVAVLTSERAVVDRAETGLQANPSSRPAECQVPWFIKIVVMVNMMIWISHRRGSLMPPVMILITTTGAISELHGLHENVVAGEEVGTRLVRTFPPSSNM
jgi:hypothetical protein